MASESWSNKSGDKTEDNKCPGACGDDFGDPYFDYWVVKTDSTGNIQWDKTIGGRENDICEVIKEVRPNVYVVGGSSNATISGDKTIGSKGYDDYWIVKLKYTNTTTSPIASINQESIMSAASGNRKFSVYPNPAKEVLHIQNGGRSATFTLTNQSGKILLTQKVNGSSSINITHLPSGVYFLKDNSTGITQKIVVAK
jgi:hypothetical protein